MVWTWESRWPFKRLTSVEKPKCSYRLAPPLGSRQLCSPANQSSFHSAPSPSISTRLAALDPTIQKIVDTAGTAGLSVGVLHEGSVRYYANYGFRDVQSKLSPSEETIYPACSLTKALVSATFATLVEEGKATWNTTVKEVLPDFKIDDDTIRNSATITDLLAHRTGMSVGDYYLGAQNNVLISEKDAMAFLSDQKAINPFRGQFQYNNLGYELAGLMINKISGRTWAELLRERIIEPLGLERTMLDFPAEEEKNVAKAYNTLDNAMPVEIRTVQATATTFSGAAAGLRTCVKDLLTLYHAFLQAAEDQFRRGTTSTPDFPLKQLTYLMSAHTPMEQTTLNEASYACGWARAELPGSLGAVGSNPPLLPDGMPIVGKNTPSRLVLYHQGSLPGALSATFLIPESETVIVVMSNSLALCDAPDWVGQLILEELLDVPEKNDYVAAATVSAAKTLEWFPSVTEELRQNQKQNTSSKPLATYTGTYWNAIRTMKIVVTVEQGELYWSVQGLDSEKYVLAHYHEDVFSWLRPRNEMAARGRWVDQGAEFWLIKFGTSEDGDVDRLAWVHDLEVSEGETFFKTQ